MAVTRLKRKARKNRMRAIHRKVVIKRLLASPVIKNVDVEKIKEELTKKSNTKTTSQVEKAEDQKRKVKAEVIQKVATKDTKASSNEQTSAKKIVVDS